jgi:cyclopropane fatty-acyl-phospholipid synthase-like methyltransferase
LPYESQLFDFLYAISIFTHLSNELAAAWMREIHRVLAADGKAFFTTHGLAYRSNLSTTEARQFDDGYPVVQFSSVEGSNLCAAYHPRRWVEAELLDGFHLIEIREPHQLDRAERSVLAQDRWLVQKVAAG